MFHFQAKPDIMEHNIANETILLKMIDGAVSNSSAIVFNEAGAFLWNCLKEKVTKDELSIELCNKYGIDGETALKDVQVFLEKCIQEDIIHQCEA